MTSFSRLPTRPWVTPGLKPGCGLKRHAGSDTNHRWSGHPGPEAGVRIETAAARRTRPGSGVTPGLKPGCGLKRGSIRPRGAPSPVTPGLKPGCGLKQSHWMLEPHSMSHPGPEAGVRIETRVKCVGRPLYVVTPGLKPGCGLKQRADGKPRDRRRVTPGLKPGCGLKHPQWHQRPVDCRVTPGLKPGCGLKLRGDPLMFTPLSSPRA